MKNILFAITFLSLSFYSVAQDKPGKNSTVQLDFSQVPTQTVSASDTSYANSLSVAPVLDLRSKSGWGITYSPAFIISGSKAGLYMHRFSAGFEKYGKGNTDLAFSYNHFILTTKTGVPYSPISNELFFYTGFTKSLLHPLLSASFGFGKDTAGNVSKMASELGVQAGINHSFNWDNAGPFSSVELTPALMINAGTNQYFSFLSASKYMGHSGHLLKQMKKKGNNAKPGNAFSGFAVSNLELNTEISLEAGRFSLNPGGSIFLPVAATDHSIYGYWQLQLQYRF